MTPPHYKGNAFRPQSPSHPRLSTPTATHTPRQPSRALRGPQRHRPSPAGRSEGQRGPAGGRQGRAPQALHPRSRAPAAPRSPQARSRPSRPPHPRGGHRASAAPFSHLPAEPPADLGPPRPALPETWRCLRREGEEGAAVQRASPSLPAALPARRPPPPRSPHGRGARPAAASLPHAAGPLSEEPRPPGAAGRAADAGGAAGKEAAFPDGPFRQRREGQRLPQPGRASPQSRGRASQGVPAASPASRSEIKCVPRSDAPLAASLVPPRRACFPGAAAWRGFETPRSVPGGSCLGLGASGGFVPEDEAPEVSPGSLPSL